MKTSSDPRHIKREAIIKQLFAFDFTQDQPLISDARKIWRRRRTLDKMISSAAPQWPVDKLNHIDLSILRLAVYELNFTDTPKKVIVDEAVELAKKYGGDAAPSFVNGVLGKLLSDGQN